MQPAWARRGWAGRGLWVDINEQEHLLGEQEESTEQCCCSCEFSSQQGLGSALGTARPILRSAHPGTGRDEAPTCSSTSPEAPP